MSAGERLALSLTAIEQALAIGDAEAAAAEMSRVLALCAGAAAGNLSGADARSLSALAARCDADAAALRARLGERLSAASATQRALAAYRGR